MGTKILCQADCLTNGLAVTAGFAETVDHHGPCLVLTLWSAGEVWSCKMHLQLPPLPWYSSLILSGL